MAQQQHQEEEHRRLIHRDQLDKLNEYYVQHHMERAQAKAAWPAALVVWGVVLGFFYYLLGDAFFPDYYWVVAFVVLAIISRIAVGFDIGVRVK